MGAIRVSSVIVVVGLAAVGCAGGDTAAPAAGLTPTAVSDPFSKASWTSGVWPFTVPDGVVKCYLEDSMVTFASGAVEYGLNVTARRFGNFRNLDEITHDGPEGYVEIGGTRQRVETNAVGLDGVISRANEFCSKRG